MASTSRSRVKVQVNKVMVVKRTSRLVTLTAGCELIRFNFWPVLLNPCSNRFDLEESPLPTEFVKTSHGYECSEGVFEYTVEINRRQYSRNEAMDKT